MIRAYVRVMFRIQYVCMYIMLSVWVMVRNELFEQILGLISK